MLSPFACFFRSSVTNTFSRSSLSLPVSYLQQKDKNYAQIGRQFEGSELENSAKTTKAMVFAKLCVIQIRAELLVHVENHDTRLA
jgi:hypothetical protein